MLLSYEPNPMNAWELIQGSKIFILRSREDAGIELTVGRVVGFREPGDDVGPSAVVLVNFSEQSCWFDRRGVGLGTDSDHRLSLPTEALREEWERQKWCRRIRRRLGGDSEFFDHLTTPEARVILRIIQRMNKRIDPFAETWG